MRGARYIPAFVRRYPFVMAEGRIMMKYILAALVIAWMMVFVRNSNAVDFSQRDKQAHALMGCGVASIVRGFATDGVAVGLCS